MSQDGATPTVYVEAMPQHAAWRMVWEHTVDERDVKRAFQRIEDILHAADTPVFIVVDITRNPRFPLRQTVTSAVAAYRHPLLEKWLVVGKSMLGETIERLLASITQERKVAWFDTEAQALAHIERQQHHTP